MSYESMPFPTAEGAPGPSGGDAPEPKKSKKKAAGAAPETPSEQSAKAPGKDKPAQDLARLFKEVVERPAGEKAPDKPKDAKPEERADETAAGDKPDDEVAVPESADGAPESEESVNQVAELTDDERREAAQQLVQARQQEVDAEAQAVEPSSVQAEASAAAAQFLEGVDTQLTAGVAPEVATAAAFEQTMGEPAPEIPGEEALVEIEPPAADSDEDNEENAAAAAGAARTAGGGAGARRGGAGIPYTAVGPGGPGYGGAPAAANMAPGSAAAPTYEVSGVASGLLVGGIVGYLLGRRRGRIKTERKLLPVQQQLDREVRALHDHLAIREAQVRQLVWERAAVETKAVAEVAAQTPEPQKVETSPAPAQKVEQIKAPASKPEAKQYTPEAVLKKEIPINDLLKIGESIVVGAATIRQVYETNLISESGLRTIIAEHLRGGNVHGALREALTAKEKTYEQDPFLARITEEQKAAEAAGGGAHNAALPLAPGNETTQQSRQDATPAQSAATHHDSDQDRTTRPLILANIVALAVLAGLLVVLVVLWLTR